MQNTQASPEFLTLPQVIPTSTPIPDLISKMYHIIAHLWIAKFIAILLFAILGLQFIRYNTVPEDFKKIANIFDAVFDVENNVFDIENVVSKKYFLITTIS